MHARGLLSVYILYMLIGYRANSVMRIPIMFVLCGTFADAVVVASTTTTTALIPNYNGLCVITFEEAFHDLHGSLDRSDVSCNGDKDYFTAWSSISPTLYFDDHEYGVWCLPEGTSAIRKYSAYCKQSTDNNDYVNTDITPVCNTLFSGSGYAMCGCANLQILKPNIDYTDSSPSNTNFDTISGTNYDYATLSDDVKLMLLSTEEAANQLFRGCSDTINIKFNLQGVTSTSDTTAVTTTVTSPFHDYDGLCVITFEEAYIDLHGAFPGIAGCDGDKNYFTARTPGSTDIYFDTNAEPAWCLTDGVSDVRGDLAYCKTSTVPAAVSDITNACNVIFTGLSACGCVNLQILKPNSDYDGSQPPNNANFDTISGTNYDYATLSDDVKLMLLSTEEAAEQLFGGCDSSYHDRFSLQGTVSTTTTTTVATSSTVSVSTITSSTSTTAASSTPTSASTSTRTTTTTQTVLVTAARPPPEPRVTSNGIAIIVCASLVLITTAVTVVVRVKEVMSGGVGKKTRP